MNNAVCVHARVIGADGIAELSTVMEFERVPVKGDFIDVILSTDEEEEACFREVQRVELSTHFMPHVYIGDESFDLDRNWDNHDFDGGGIGETMAWLIRVFFDGWEIDERKTCWSTDFNRWMTPEYKAYSEQYETREAIKATT